MTDDAEIATNTRNEDKSVKNNDEVSPALATLTIQKQETIKSKNIDVAAEYQKKGRKNAANFVVIGMYLSSSVVIILNVGNQVTSTRASRL